MKRLGLFGGGLQTAPRTAVTATTTTAAMPMLLCDCSRPAVHSAISIHVSLWQVQCSDALWRCLQTAPRIAVTATTTTAAMPMLLCDCSKPAVHSAVSANTACLHEHQAWYSSMEVFRLPPERPSPPPPPWLRCQCSCVTAADLQCTAPSVQILRACTNIQLGT